MYAGTRFRSRLEARWAAMFDAIGWRWEYEPFDCEGWIPDFLILGGRPMLVEVKPHSTVAELVNVAEAESRRCPPGYEVLAVGCVPIPDDGAAAEYSWHLPAGALAERVEHHPSVWWAMAARWHTCLECEAIAVHHETCSYAGRPCGHYEGDHTRVVLAPRALQGAWAEARNATQWRRA
jgi:hypothetical protein